MLLSTAFAREAPLGAAFVRLVSVIDREIQPLRSCHRNRRCPVTLLALLAAMIAAPDLVSAQEIVAPPRASLQTSQTNPSPAQTNPSPAQTADQTPDQRAAQTERLQSDIGYLASDELRGRGVGDVSIDQAAQYISQRMSEIGLETDAWEGSPMQPFQVVLGARPAAAERNRLVLQPTDSKEPSVVVSLDQGFNPMAVGSSSGEVSGPVVFAGYGVTAPDFDYDDYEGIEVSGALVMILRKEPQRNDPNSRFRGTRNTQHAFFSTKIENAIKHGASAVILVNDPDSVMQAVQNVRSKIEREKQRREGLQRQLAELPESAENSRAKLRETSERVEESLRALEQELADAGRGVLGISEAGRRTEGSPSIPVVSIARDLADQWLSRYAGESLESLEQSIDQTGSPHSRTLADVRASLLMELEPLQTETSNVLGFLPGKGDLSDETVVIGAHYDHVGMGGEGSLAPGTIAVHNGADDNASGTSAMLGVAGQIHARLASTDSHRRVVFLAFSGEERGLLGSKHYVRQPRFPLDSTVTMVNLDMVGRLRDNELTIYGTGSAEGFDQLVEQANQQQAEPFRLFKVETGYGPSDHQSFYESGVPVLFFFTGIHNDYHRPTDDSDKIDFGGLTRITDIVSDVVFELATRQGRPVYAKTENRVQIRRQLTAFLGVSLRDAPDHVTVSDVVAGGPADQGGIKTGDQLQKLGDQQVKTAVEVIEWVRARSPGDKVQVVITRNGQEETLTVQLARRPG